MLQNATHIPVFSALYIIQQKNAIANADIYEDLTAIFTVNPCQPVATVGQNFAVAWQQPDTDC